MEPAFWRSRWAENRIAFHEVQPNAFLQRHVARLGSARRVLVPLCGKSVDLVWLAAQGHQVVGVELVEAAVQRFFEEQQLTPQITTREGLVFYQAGSITIVAGDFFTTTRALLGLVDALYDRAALIALPASLRVRYVEHLSSLLELGSPGLLITVEYPQEAMEGPPFSVTAHEVAGYRPRLTAELLEQRPSPLPQLVGGVGHEACYAVTAST